MSLRQISGIQIESQLGSDQERWCRLGDVAKRLGVSVADVWRRYKDLEADERGTSPWSPDLGAIFRYEPEMIEPDLYVTKWWAQTAIWLAENGISGVEYKGMQQTPPESVHQGRTVRKIKFVQRVGDFPAREA